MLQDDYRYTSDDVSEAIGVKTLNWSVDRLKRTNNILNINFISQLQLDYNSNTWHIVFLRLNKDVFDD